MKQIIIGKQESHRLLLFFNGWGMDFHPFVSLKEPDRDFLCCYDYRDLTFDTEMLSRYQEIEVVAWSLGVWVANKVLAEQHLPVCSSTAINGTLTPIHEEQGIPAAIFQGTIDHLDERGLRKFQRRMCQSADDFQSFLKVAPQREAAELKEELICLQESITLHPDTPIGHWDKVYIGLNDRIFPAENQKKAWESLVPIRLIPEGHYCPELFKQLTHHDQ